MYLYTLLGFTPNDPPHQFVNILRTYLVHYVVLISKYLDLLISKSLQFFFLNTGHLTLFFEQTLDRLGL